MLFILLPVLFLLGCGESSQSVSSEPETVVESISTTAVETAPPSQTLAPLKPTFTPAGNQAAEIESSGNETAQLPPIATQPPAVDLNQPVLSLSYKVPAISLNRELTANLAGKITLVDLTTGNQVSIPNGQRFLTEIVGAIEANKDAFLPVPADCDTCVTIGFELPAAGETASGILTDPQLQVSIRHLFATRLGPHFPPSTVIGHHRSASGYTVAHTAALLESGELVTWIAADPEVQISTGVSLGRDLDSDAVVLAKYNGVDFVTACPNFPNEIIVIQSQAILVRCPELALGQGLIEIYQTANSFSNNLLADERNLAIPQTVLPFDSRLYFEKADGSHITIFSDGQVQASYPVTQTQTISGTEQTIELDPQLVQSSLPVREIEPLIIPLLASDVIPRGVTTSISQDQSEFEEILLIRGDDGVYEFAWADGVGQELLPGIQILDLLLDRLRPEPAN